MFINCLMKALFFLTSIIIVTTEVLAFLDRGDWHDLFFGITVSF